MFFNRLSAPAQQRVTVSDFGGLDLRPRCAEGSFTFMENLCSDGYPALQSRPRRAVATRIAEPEALTEKETLVWLSGRTLYVGGHETGLMLTAGEKQFVSMGAYLLLFPDKKWINLRDLTDFGSMENTVTTDGEVNLTLCRGDGTAYGDYLADTLPPVEPEEGTLWLDTSGAVPVLRVASGGVWTEAADVCVRLRGANIGAGFAVGDGVEITGCEADTVNGLHVLRQAAVDTLVVEGILPGDMQQTAPITVRRAVPDMDFVTECGNRLWGCKYGVVEGRAVNEIYASKLGDFKNWNCYAGLATDSYAASRGSDGPFTAAATYLGSALFFKERCIERVYPSATGAHQIVTLECPGVSAGNHRSVCAVDGTLFYVGRGGVYGFDGGLPAVTSRALGDMSLHSGVAGCREGKYYLSCADGENMRHLLVYDTRRGLWHREDRLDALGFAVWNGTLYALDRDGVLWDMQGGGAERESHVSWAAVSGEWGLGTAIHKYPLRLSLRAAVEEGGSVTAELSYDEGGTWQRCGEIRGTGLTDAHTLHIRPRRCPHLRLRLMGRGDCRLYSVSAVYEKGSDEV